MNRELIETISCKVVIPGCFRKGGVGSVSGTHMGLVRPVNLVCITRLDHRRNADEKEKGFKILSGRKILQLIHRCSEDTKKAKDGV